MQDFGEFQEAFSRLAVAAIGDLALDEKMVTATGGHRKPTGQRLSVFSQEMTKATTPAMASRACEELICKIFDGTELHTLRAAEKTHHSTADARAHAIKQYVTGAVLRAEDDALEVIE